MSRSRIKKTMRKIRLRKQIDNFFLLKRIFIITIFAKSLSNLTSNFFKNLKLNDVSVVKQSVFKSIITLLTS